ncbi:ELM1/GtrOC1 family putative glycosyltransferase [Salinisphaera sp. T31B1]|uniref:ELM1/GtrOC1 family putative glycosyltransferase n=1 Tax=Salinisphaera sp. T31B1 TaxID=727963 RepID=UPI0033402121
MAIRSRRVLTTFVQGDLRHACADQTGTYCIRLTPREGVVPSAKPPVRIFMGTEAVQFRAERAFVWSIERVRDPARTYEIHLMRDLAGFERRLWLTGFTNYRFVIPELAGGRGRAIYNDADQIYLSDPARLFDLEMGEAGVLSINDRDTSVMLIDCEKMRPLWNGAAARRTGNRELEKRMREAGLWADLDDAWNARDAEYVPDVSHVVHYTTIHSQPWRPTPQDYVYRANPAEAVWTRIDREADEAGFQLFGPEQPSPAFRQRAGGIHAEPEAAARRAEIQRLARDAAPESLLYCGGDEAGTRASVEAIVPRAARRIASIDFTALTDPVSSETVDMVAVDGLAQLPDLDIAWVLDALFARARRAISVHVSLDSSRHRSTPADQIWWYQQMAAAGARYPDRHWRLAVRWPRRLGKTRVWRWSGGALLSRRPRVWALLHYKTGHRSQALGVADALGWPFETRDLVREPLRYASALARERLGLGGPSLPGGLRPPWPEVVIASGWLPAVMARTINARNRGASRLILLGRRGGRVGESQDIGLVCRHFDLPPNPRELITTLPPNKVDDTRLAAARARWPNLYAPGVSPRIAWLVGGNSAQHELTPAMARRLAEQIRAATTAESGQLAVLTSRRTGADGVEAIREAVGRDTIFEPWNAHAGDANPYLGYLANADVLIVTGESESMLAEAVATGKPVYIVALPERAPGVRRRLADWVVGQANTDRFNARGSRRPQEGLQYLCARLVERRVFVPRRNMPQLHQALVNQGVARLFDGHLSPWTPPVWHETEWVAQRIRALLPAAGRSGSGAEGARPVSRALHG